MEIKPLLFQSLAQLAGVPSISQRCFQVHDPGAHQLLDLPIKVLHTLGSPVLQSFKQSLARAIIALNVLHGARGRLEDLQGGDAATIPARNELLRDYITQSLSQPAANRRLL